MFFSSPPIYLDHAAMSPLRIAIEPQHANSSSLHKAGEIARTRLAHARQRVADQLGAQEQEIIFTSGGTESINLALLGIARANKAKGTHIVSTSIEHKATLRALAQLETEGFSVTYVSPLNNGIVPLEDVIQAITPQTLLVSVMYVNNEIGTIQSISEIGKRIAAHEQRPYFHVDACQASAYLALQVRSLHVDAMSINASKIGGPVGVGVLYRKTGIEIHPLLFGGNQEFHLRPGTEPVYLYDAYAQVFSQVRKTYIQEAHKIRTFRALAIEVLEAQAGLQVLGDSDEHLMAPHIIAVQCTNADAEEIQSRLSAKGVYVGVGSACNTQSNEPSHVLSAIGLSAEQSAQVIRISFGYNTTKEEVKKAIALLVDIYQTVSNS